MALIAALCASLWQHVETQFFSISPATCYDGSGARFIINLAGLLRLPAHNPMFVCISHRRQAAIMSFGASTAAESATGCDPNAGGCRAARGKSILPGHPLQSEDIQKQFGLRSPSRECQDFEGPTEQPFTAESGKGTQVFCLRPLLLLPF